MSEVDGGDLEAATAVAWEQFQERLAEYLEGSQADDIVVLELETADDGAEVSRYVQMAHDGGVIRLEVSSNADLTGPHRLDGDLPC